MPNDPSNPTPQQLLAALVLSWEEDTAAKDSGWSETVPSLGQSAVTSLVVQDYFAGRLWQAWVPGRSSRHYWVAFCNFGTIDFTGGQFVYSRDMPLYRQAEQAYRRVLLENEDTARRYITLSARVGKWLKVLCQAD